MKTPIQHFVGIDPGQSGAIAVVNHLGEFEAWMKFDGADPLAIVKWGLSTLEGRSFAVALEDVHAAPGQGVTSMFTFGRGLGRIEGLLAAMEIEVRLVSPQSWQAWLPDCGMEARGKERVAAWVEKHWGCRAFIGEGCRVPHEGGMDAGVIAEYLRRLHLGLVKPPAKRSKVKKKQPIKL